MKTLKTRSRGSPRPNLNWWFSIVLGIAYLGVFHLWLRVRSPWVLVSGLGVAVFLAVLLMIAVRQRYFVNFWDALFHASVVLDIVLEATWIERHEHVGFYLCAAAFAVVLIGYRLWFVRGVIRKEHTLIALNGG